MEKARSVRVIEGKDHRHDANKYFLPMEARSTYKVLERVMSIKISHNEEISGGKNRGERSWFCYLMEQRRHK